MTIPVIVVGAGGFGRECAEVIRICPQLELAGFVDDNAALHGQELLGAKVLGPVSMVHDVDAQVVVTIGNPTNYGVRKRIVDELGLDDARYATVVHPDVEVVPSVSIGVGSVITKGCVMTSQVAVGRHVVMMPNVVLTHDDVVDDYVTFGAGVCVAGGVLIEEGAYIGSSSAVREGLTVGARAMVGMGAVVTRNIPAETTWVGVPARQL